MLSVALVTILGASPLAVADSTSGVSFVLRVNQASFCGLFPSEYSRLTQCAGFDLANARAAFEAQPDPKIRTVFVGAGDAEPSGELFISVVALKVDSAVLDVSAFVAGERETAEKANGKLASEKPPQQTRAGKEPACTYTLEYSGESTKNSLQLLVPVSADTVLSFSLRGPRNVLELLVKQRDTLIGDLKIPHGKRVRLSGCGAAPRAK